MAEADNPSDARLIAAAPAMLEALTYILDLAAENAKGQDGYEQLAEWSRAAIAAATSKEAERGE